MIEKKRFQEEQQKKKLYHLKSNTLIPDIETISNDMNNLSRHLYSLPEEIRYLIQTGQYEDINNCVGVLIKNGNRLLNLSDTITKLLKQEVKRNDRFYSGNDFS